MQSICTGGAEINSYCTDCKPVAPFTLANHNRARPTRHHRGIFFGRRWLVFTHNSRRTAVWRVQTRLWGSPWIRYTCRLMWLCLWSVCCEYNQWCCGNSRDILVQSRTTFTIWLRWQYRTHGLWRSSRARRSVGGNTSRTYWSHSFLSVGWGNESRCSVSLANVRGDMRQQIGSKCGKLQGRGRGRVIRCTRTSGLGLRGLIQSTMFWIHFRMIFHCFGREIRWLWLIMPLYGVFHITRWATRVVGEWSMLRQFQTRTRLRFIHWVGVRIAEVEIHRNWLGIPRRKRCTYRRFVNLRWGLKQIVKSLH